MPDPLDDANYYARRIAAAEARAAEADSLAARHAHEGLAKLYREQLARLLRGPVDHDDDEHGA